jgi:hypothetical protein
MFKVMTWLPAVLRGLLVMPPTVTPVGKPVIVVVMFPTVGVVIPSVTVIFKLVPVAADPEVAPSACVKAHGGGGVVHRFIQAVPFQNSKQLLVVL